MIALLSFLYGRPVMANSYDNFHHLKTSSEEIRAIYPDSSGRIWLGTIHGIIRYGDFPPDHMGYAHYPEVFKAGVHAIHGFSGDKLLVRLLDGRYVVYNPRLNQIEGDFDKNLEEWGIDFNNHWDLNMMTGQHGDIFCFTYNKAYARMDNRTVKIAELPERIRNIGISKDELCIATDSVIYIYNYDRKDFRLKSKITNIVPVYPRRLLLTVDGKGNIWIGNTNLFRYDRESRKWSIVKENISISDMMLNYNGEILVATNSTGLLRYDSNGNLLQEIRHIPYDSNYLAADNIRWIAEGPDTTLWICYNKRMMSVCNPSYLDSSLKHIPDIKRQGFDDDIIAIAQDSNGAVWLGSDSHGLFRHEPGSDSFSHFNLNGESDISVTEIFFDSKERMWVATYRNGVFCVEGNKISHFLNKESVYGITEDAKGTIWLGLLGGGLYILDSNLDSEPVHVPQKGNNWILQLSGDGDRTIYAVTSTGIITVDTETHDIKRLNGTGSGNMTLENNHFQSMFKDSRGLLWLIGQRIDAPVEIFDANNDTIVGIPQLSGQTMKSIIEDNDKNIWIATEQNIIHIIVNYDTTTGLYKFLPSIYRFKNPDDDSSVYYNYRASTRLKDGKLLFGSSDGFRMIDPKNFPPHVSHVSAPRLYFASIKVNDQYLKARIPFNGRIVLDEDVMSATDITLDHNENNLTLTIGSRGFTSSYYTDMYFRLNGRDSEWRPVRGNIIELSDLDPGEYKLEVCSERADGIKSDNAITLGIKINAPWYSTIWAYIIYVILAIGIIILAIYYYIDRQKQKMYVSQIKQEAERQYQLNEMKLRFFTNISHDFRTPLSLIITPLEAFMSDEANKSSEKYLRPVYKNAVRLLNLINQILDFRKIDVNGAVLNLSYGDIVAFVRDICSSFTLFAEDTAKTLSFNSSVAGENMYFDKDKVTKIMMNLLSNSFKFTKPKGKVTVDMNISGDEIVISVADDGPGIPDSDKSKIFDRFYQTESMPADYTGSGIGLHIVKEFVKLHNGSVTVTDNHPTGSVFTLRLPIIKTNPDPEKETVEVKEDEENIISGVDDGQPNLLLVEDNTDFLEFMKDQLSGTYRVTTATNGAEALNILEKQDVNIIISDIMMDGIDGLELCRRVKSDLSTSHIPVILLTAKALAEDEMRGFECGADDYITKPFNMSILFHRIKKILSESIKSQKRFKEKLDVNPSEVTITSLDEQFLSNAINCVEANMASPDFSVETMSSMLGVHRTQLYKKLVNLTGKTPVEFIRLIRLKRAAQYLAKSQMFISEIAYTVGFGSPKIFSKHFKDEFGMSPRDFQNEHSGTSTDTEKREN